MIVIGKVYITDGKQMLHHKPLPKTCYKVSIQELLVDTSCISDIGNNDFKTVKDAVGSFVAWPKDQVVLIDQEKVTPPSTIPKDGEKTFVSKLLAKRKFVSSALVLRQDMPNKKIQKNYSCDYIKCDIHHFDMLL
ncbi:unnamed protein product [Lactuca virosa]|uniref:DUF8039 domain-containing protein n=1 Tax=Lactuca virosa TaxID=75947 RepID=A0AAU9NUR0_9ASTR|nr:unnamed protein product [Lactuca virosa]